MWAMMLRQRILARSVKRSIVAARGRSVAAVGWAHAAPDQLLACPGSREPRNGHMANIKSQKKRNKQNERRRDRNKAVRSELKTRVKLASAALTTEAEDAQELVQAAQKRLGKAAASGVIHKNQAARRTSRMMK